MTGQIMVRLYKDGAFPINETLAGVVPMATDREQEVLTESIRTDGQREPIVLWRGEIVDGRCRQKALRILQRPIMYKELDSELPEEEVAIFVKTTNTRRNLTNTQKAMVAAKKSLNKTYPMKVQQAADHWGVSKRIVENGRYLWRNYPKVAEALFDGKSVVITNQHGSEILSNKITAVYAYYRRKEEEARGIEEDTAMHGWSEDSYIRTQKGKEWYYKQIEIAKEVGDIKYKMLVAELANYKFNDKKREANEK